MSNVTELTNVGRQYEAAYAAHYTDRDLAQALRLYKAILDSHPSAIEAAYSRMQVRNILTAAVPPAELLEAELDLARRYVQK